MSTDALTPPLILGVVDPKRITGGNPRRVPEEHRTDLEYVRCVEIPILTFAYCTACTYRNSGTSNFSSVAIILIDDDLVLDDRHGLYRCSLCRLSTCCHSSKNKEQGNQSDEQSFHSESQSISVVSVPPYKSPDICASSLRASSSRRNSLSSL